MLLLVGTKLHRTGLDSSVSHVRPRHGRKSYEPPRIAVLYSIIHTGWMDGWKCSNFKVDGYGFALRSPRHRYLFASLCEPRSQRFASILSGSTVSGPRRAACRVGESDMPNSWLTIHTNLRSGLRYRRIMQSYWYICMILYILAYIPVIRLTQCVEITMALWTCGGWVQKRKKKPLLPEAGATMVTWVKYLVPYPSTHSPTSLPTYSPMYMG